MEHFILKLYTVFLVRAERSQPGRVSSSDPWALCFWVLWQHSDVAAPWYWGPWARRRRRCHFAHFLSFLLYSFVILHDLENYFFLLVTLRELIAVALHARQVWCYFTLNLRTVKLQRRSWNRLRTSSGLSSGVLAAQPVWFEGRRGCKTGSTGQRSQRMLWSTTLQIGCDSGIFEKHWEATNTSIQFQPTAAQGIYQIGFLASGSWPSPCVDIVDSLWRV